MQFKIKVSPSSCKDEISGWQGEWLKIRVKAPPNDGKANDAVLSLLATDLQVPKNSIRITSGHTSRIKRISVSTPCLNQNSIVVLRQTTLQLE
jgi:uncharacterized protein (TIGR00251 family)